MNGLDDGSSSTVMDGMRIVSMFCCAVWVLLFMDLISDGQVMLTGA